MGGGGNWKICFSFVREAVKFLTPRCPVSSVKEGTFLRKVFFNRTVERNTMEREEEIRSLAYRIWLEEGCPDGRNVEHWLRAETMTQRKNGEQHPEPEVRRPPRKRVRRSRIAQEAGE
jgi:Protein of unknown function (DUF2934)